MEALYDTLKNITIYVMLISLVSNLLVGSVYKKYIRFFAGLVITALVINPISRLLNEGSDIFENIKLYDLNLRVDEYEQNIRLYQETDIEKYDTICREIINEILNKYDLVLDDYEIEQDISTGKPTYIYVSAFMTKKLSAKDTIIDGEGNVGNKSLEMRAEKLKSDVCESFGVLPDIVEIYVGP